MNNSVSKLRVAGANNVIMPDKVGGAHMASLVVMPDVLEFLDHVRIQGADAINLEEIPVNVLPQGLKASTLGELDARNRVGVNVVGVKSPTGTSSSTPAQTLPLTMLANCLSLALSTKSEPSIACWASNPLKSDSNHSYDPTFHPFLVVLLARFGACSGQRRRPHQCGHGYYHQCIMSVIFFTVPIGGGREVPLCSFGCWRAP